MEHSAKLVSQSVNDTLGHPVPKIVRSPFVARRLVLALCVLSCAGCAVPEVPARVVYEDPTNFVRLEPDAGVRPNDQATFHHHPASIGAEDMAGILRGLRVRDHRIGIHAHIAGEAPWEPAFEDDQIAVLAPRLVEALALAAPSELVTFYISTPQTSINREITSGGLYLQGNHLHFILANRSMIYGVPAHGMVYDRRYPMKPTDPKWFDLSFEPEAAMVKQKPSAIDLLLGREKDELVIDLGTLGLGLPVV